MDRLADSGDGCIVGEADNGIAAAQLVQSFRPALVLMNVNIAPLQGGSANAEHSHRRTPWCSSASPVTAGMVEKARLSGAAYVNLLKDTLGQQLLPWVAKMLGGRDDEPNGADMAPARTSGGQLMSAEGARAVGATMAPQGSGLTATLSTPSARSPNVR
jgi:DNA-binding NarL/FixJ family response regulator